MKVTKTKDFKMAYLINERKLRELESIINEISVDIEYRVSCIDGTSMNFANLEDLINFPNRKDKQYKDIVISNSYSSTISISITLSQVESRSINYRVSGEERDVDFYSGKIEEYIMSLKQWYSFLGAMHTMTHLASFLIVYVSLVFLLMILNIIESAESVWISLPIGLFAMYIFDKVRVYLFPVASFELGDGIDRVKNKNSIRSFILVGILVAGVVGYIVNQLPSITGR